MQSLDQGANVAFSGHVLVQCVHLCFGSGGASSATRTGKGGWVGGRFKRPLGVSSHYLSKERLLPERNSEASISFRSLVPPCCAV